MQAQDDLSEEEDPVLIQNIQAWAQRNYKQEVLLQQRRDNAQRMAQAMRQRQQAQQQQQQDQLQRSAVRDTAATLNRRAATTDGFIKGVSGARRGFNDNASSQLKGRANDLQTLETDLKSSSRFKALMDKLREYEAAAAQAGGNYYTTQSKRVELKLAAEAVRDHVAADYKKEIAKNDDKDAHVRGYKAAVSILNTIADAELERTQALADATTMLDRFEAQIDQRQQNGAPPIDTAAMQLLELMGKSSGVPSAVAYRLDLLLKRARAVEGDAIYAAVANEPDTYRREVFEVRAKTCFALGGSKATSGSAAGASDSFFLKDHKGKNAFVFKPMEGEADQSARGWERGGAAPREMLASTLNEEMAKLGLGCGVSKTALVTLSDPSFKQGSASKAETRTGALQEFAASDGSVFKLLGQPNSTTPDNELKDFCSDPVELARRKQRIKAEDVQKIAVFDFITMNLDRSTANMLSRSEGDPPNEIIHLTPIDSGNLLPCREALSMGIDGLAPQPKDAANALGEGNALMQLPQADQPFDPAVAAQIDALDPDALTQAVQGSYAQIGQDCPAMQGTVKTEAFDMMKLSMKFLKRACGSQANPKLTPADMAQMYHAELVGFFDRVLGPANPQPNSAAFVPPTAQAIEQEMDRLIGEQIRRRQAAVQLKQTVAAANMLGGQKRLVDLGWPVDQLLKDADRALLILKGNEDHPEQIAQYNQEGGDKLLTQLGGRLDQGDTVKQKRIQLDALVKQDKYQRLGGDAAYKKALQAYAPELERIKRQHQQDDADWRRKRDAMDKALQGAWFKTPEGKRPSIDQYPFSGITLDIDKEVTKIPVLGRLTNFERLKQLGY